MVIMMNGKCDVPGCKAPARHYGMDRQGLVFDMCEGDFRIYFDAVETGQMPEPKIKCARCGGEKILRVHQFDKLVKMMDNRVEKRPKDPVYLCSEKCCTKAGSWGKTGFGIVDYDYQEVEEVDLPKELEESKSQDKSGFKTIGVIG